MDFGLTDEQRRLREEIVSFAKTQLNDDVIQRDADGVFSPDAWKKCAALGIQGLPVPEAYGGAGADAVTVVLALEALGYGCVDNGLIFSLNAQIWSCETPLIRFGSDAQRARYLPGLCEGSSIGVQAMTEPDTGSDAFALTSTAERRGDVFVLHGTKTFITNAPVADVFVVFASTDPTAGFAGISAFIVERDRPGLTVGPPFKKMGLRTSPMGEVIFDGCEVPVENVLGTLGSGMAIFKHSMLWERSCILASAVGTMERQLERSIAYARERKQFGQRIGKFQAVAHRIAEMKTRLEAARLLLYRQAWLLGRDTSSEADAAMVKLFLSEALEESSLDALHVHGGYGYMTEYELERDVRDAIAGRLYSGTSEIQKNIIAASLRL